MATTILHAFEEFKTNLEITDRQESLVSSRREAVVEAIDQELWLHSDQPSLVIGSWDRQTLTRYLFEGDVDVMVVLHYNKNKNWDSGTGATAALERFGSILRAAYPSLTIRRDRNCITMRFKEFRLDVVPAFRFNQGYYTIPDSVRGMWVKTNPIVFASLITYVNKRLNGTFVPLIKMVKAWNRDKSWPVNSFHLECMMYDHHRDYYQGHNYPSTLNAFFGKLPGYLSAPAYDPVLGDRVDSYLDNGATPSRREIAINKARDAAADAAEAFEDQEKYPSVAIGEWRALLGEFFPADG